MFMKYYQHCQNPYMSYHILSYTADSLFVKVLKKINIYQSYNNAPTQ